MRLGDVPAWLAWITTFGVLVVALVQIATERRRRHETEAREAAERHIEQARLISAILGPEELSAGRPDVGRTAVNLVNGSDEPVYMRVVGIVFIQGAGGPRTIEEQLQMRQRLSPHGPVPVTTAGILPGGTFRVWINGVGGRASWEDDRAQKLRSPIEPEVIGRALGKLEALAEDPLEYFQRWEMYGPYDLQTPERVE